LSDDRPPAATTFAVLLHEAARQLHEISGDDARLEAEVLLAHALGSDRAHVLASLSQAVPSDVVESFESLLNRRLAREPLAYIVGVREFFGLELECAPGALIPRPETEMLVEIALEELSQRDRALAVADIGTGTGAVAVAIARSSGGSNVVATEASQRALPIARRNAEHHGVAGSVHLVLCDLLRGLRTFDVIVANLPYVADVEWDGLSPEIREHEPREALAGGADGTDVLRAMLTQAPEHLASGGLLVLEIGATQGAAMRDAASCAFPDARVSVIKDFAGLDRVVVVRR
jgi:release factor glutamine methyltransferase